MWVTLLQVNLYIGFTSRFKPLYFDYLDRTKSKVRLKSTKYNISELRINKVILNIYNRGNYDIICMTNDYQENLNI